MAKAKEKKKSSPGPISDDPNADSGVESASGGGGAPGGGYGASRGKMGDGLGLTIILIGKRHSNMMKRAK